MRSLTPHINLLRYLIVWRVNSSLVRTPDSLAVDISYALGRTIINRLPTSDAKPWYKTLEFWTGHPELWPSPPSFKASAPPADSQPPDTLQVVPGAPWPVECAILPYPAKRSYGAGELIMWELKLFGEHADHTLFVETLLPAMEEVSTAPNLGQDDKYSLWGHFDISAVFVARGTRWEPFIQEGQLDLSYRPTPVQWSEHLDEEDGRVPQSPATLIWLTPFACDHSQTAVSRSGSRKARRRPLPDLQALLEALLIRISQVLPGKYATVADVWSLFSDEEVVTLEHLLEEVSQQSFRQTRLTSCPKGWPEPWIGAQRFASLPPAIMPFLELASILHLGKHTHFGYGTFIVR